MIKYKIKNLLTQEVTKHIGIETDCYIKAKEHITKEWGKTYKIIEVTL